MKIIDIDKFTENCLQYKIDYYQNNNEITIISLLIGIQIFILAIILLAINSIISGGVLLFIGVILLIIPYHLHIRKLNNIRYIKNRWEIL